jgi:hypothetical protein
MFLAEFAKAARKMVRMVPAINTLVGAAFNIFTRKPKINNATGELSVL